MNDSPYAERCNPNLPWGYWLIASEDGEELRDEHGNLWESVRDCLWRGRLRMGSHNIDTVESQLEFLLAILVAIDRRIVQPEESVHDLFDGAWHLHDHYGLWLEGAGLTTQGITGQLTEEGKAVLLMLASTRSAGSAPLPIGLAALTPRIGLDRGETKQERERVLAANEAFARELPYRFVREPIGTRPAIKLLGAQIGRNLPLTRTLWSMTFPDDHARDRLFAWLVHRIDRWDEWGDLVVRKNAPALSNHLLQLAFADQKIDRT